VVLVDIWEGTAPRPEVEIALAEAEARCGVIPREAADDIARLTDVSATPVSRVDLTIEPN